MATFEIVETRKVTVRYIEARCGVRYWEDATINGVVDDDGSRIPRRDGDNWVPIIDVDEGVVQEWPAGVVADIHYKVCDDGTYTLLDENLDEVAMRDGYVPKIMCPGGDGFGDYVIMQIDGDGRVANWKADLSGFGRSP